MQPVKLTVLRSVQEIEGKKYSHTLIDGPPKSGRSTLANALFEFLSSRGESVFLRDTDPGVKPVPLAIALRSRHITHIVEVL